MLLRTAYSMLLSLYPADFRAEFGGEMAAVFEQAAAQRSARGAVDLLLFAANEMCGLVAGAARERAQRPVRMRAAEDLPFPSDIAGMERYLQAVSQGIVHAIANHDFASARRYDVQDRKARALLAQLRAQAN